MAARRNINKASKNVEEWEKFVNGMREKRMKRNGRTSGKRENSSSKGIGACIVSNKEMIVEPPESEATGKAKERTGPQDFVEFLEDEVTLEAIRKACNKHFATKINHGITCDILAVMYRYVLFVYSCSVLYQCRNM